MDWLKLAQLIFGEAVQIVPIFIHNPQSQKLEAIIITTLENVLAGLASTQIIVPAAK